MLERPSKIFVWGARVPVGNGRTLAGDAAALAGGSEHASALPTGLLDINTSDGPCAALASPPFFVSHSVWGSTFHAPPNEDVDVPKSSFGGAYVFGDDFIVIDETVTLAWRSFGWLPTHHSV
jgi:hypothetical protein